ncbi:NAD(P)H-binding protein [Psychroserpens sp.]|uniref:NAD(P)H-binding protein n=1 Tax=Psychroserpens sp. TaxID=2020870 RepID=UPI003C708433
MIIKKTAIILGASGLTGGHILKKLIDDDRYETIKLFSRSKLEGQPEKVEQYIGDLLDMEQFTSHFTADEVYCCIGTTKRKTPDKTLYKKIDCGIPVSAAKLAKANNIDTFLVMSSMGADKDSSTFYTKVKGEMEASVRQQKIKHTYLFRPTLIGGDRDDKRILENIELLLFKAIKPILIGFLRKYRITKAETIAKAMIFLANTQNDFEVIVTSEAIQKLGNTN